MISPCKQKGDNSIADAQKSLLGYFLEGRNSIEHILQNNIYIIA